MQRAVDAVAANTRNAWVEPAGLRDRRGRRQHGRGMSGGDTKDADQLGGIAIELIDADLRPYSSFAFVAPCRTGARCIRWPKRVSFRGWRGGPGAMRSTCSSTAPDAPDAEGRRRGAADGAGAIPEVSAVEDNLAYDKEELILDLTPQGEALGFTIDDAGPGAAQPADRDRGGDLSRRATQRRDPRGAARGRADGRFPRPDADAHAGKATYVPLADIVSVEARTGFSTIGAKTACA
jgi:hypothetical protein